MASIDKNFIISKGLTVGPTTITSATGNITIGNTTIDGATGSITVGSTTIDGATGAIQTSANLIVTGAGSLTVGNSAVGGASSLESPAFTGTPTAPTASSAINNTQIATTAFVATAVSNGVSPLATKASPTFTGTPSAPTATSGTNTTQLATTAFVTSAVASTAFPVTSVFGRTGAVALQSGDVTGALTYTPYNATNPDGFQTSVQVSSAITAAAYSLPTATTSTLGGVKVDGTTVTITNGTISSVGSATTTTANITVWSGTPYDIYGSCFGVPAASQVDLRFVTGRAFTVPSNVTGGQAKAGTAATASTVFIIQKNGAQVATVTFAAAGTTGTYSSQAAISFAAGDVFKIVAPATADATLADIDFYLPATLN